jgi:hypothetical protein
LDLVVPVDKRTREAHGLLQSIKPHRVKASFVVAKSVLTVIKDDLDGSPEASTIEFALDGVSYTVDLAARNEEKLRQALSPYLEVARRVREERGRARGRGATRVGPDKERNASIRAWAEENGVLLAQRGRIAGAVIEAFDANSKAALYEAVGLEMDEAPRRGRRRGSLAAEFAQAG